MKRAEHRLSSTWQLLNGMQKQLRVLAALQRELGVECPGTTAVWAMLRNCLSMRSDMAHFCSNLQVCSFSNQPYPCQMLFRGKLTVSTTAIQHYIMFEVLEGAWAELQTRLDAVGKTWLHLH
jgi:hypothetical protein